MTKRPRKVIRLRLMALRQGRGVMLGEKSGKLGERISGKFNNWAGGAGAMLEARQSKTPVERASRGLEIRIITQERHIQAFPAREG